FRYDPSAVDTVLARIDQFMQHVDSAAGVGATDAERRESVRRLLGAYGFIVNQEAIDLLVTPATRTMLRTGVGRTVRTEMPLGVAADNDYLDSQAPQWRVIRGGRETLIDRDSVRTQTMLHNSASRTLSANAPPGLADLQ